MLKVVLEAYKFRCAVGKLSIENLEHWVKADADFYIEYFAKESDLPFEAYPFGRGYVFANDVVKIIYIRAKMTNYEIIETLIHESGHIILNEKFPDLPNSEAERIVINFTEYVLHPNKIFYFLYLFFAKKIVFFVLIAALFLQANFCIFKYKREMNGNGRVYITKNGDCYHTEDCGTVKNSEKIPIKLSEAEKGYNKCKVCNPKNIIFE